MGRPKKVVPEVEQTSNPPDQVAAGVEPSIPPIMVPLVIEKNGRKFFVMQGAMLHREFTGINDAIDFALRLSGRVGCEAKFGNSILVKDVRGL